MLRMQVGQFPWQKAWLQIEKHQLLLCDWGCLFEGSPNIY